MGEEIRGSRESGASEVQGHLPLHVELRASLEYLRPGTKQKRPSEQVLRRDPEETGLGCSQVSSIFVGHQGCRGRGGRFLPHPKCAVTTRHRALRTPLTLPFAPLRLVSPSGQYALEKDGKTHKNLPNKINMQCRQKPRWVGREVSVCSPMGRTRQKWLAAAEKCVISRSMETRTRRLNYPPRKKQTEKKKWD